MYIYLLKNIGSVGGGDEISHKYPYSDIETT